MKLYWNYRYTYFNKWNGRYSPKYLAEQQFPDYAWIVTIRDNEIPENRYIKVNANWMKNLTRFLTYELVDWVDETEFRKSVDLIKSQNAISLFDTVEEAREDVRNRTDLEEDPDVPGKFLIREEYTNEQWETVPAEYLIID